MIARIMVYISFETPLKRNCGGSQPPDRRITFAGVIKQATGSAVRLLESAASHIKSNQL
jgi:hypothetical protein